jgi:ribonuclease BN (tRNA processing enzyme)
LPRTELRVLFSLLVLLPLGGQAAPGVEIQVLGSGGPRPSAQASAGTLVLLDGAPRILVDAGQGTLLRAGEERVDLSALDVVLLTHLHVDHSVEVPAFVIARSLDSSAPVHLRVFGPPGSALFPSTVQWSERLFGTSGLYRYVRQFGAETRVLATNVAPPPGKATRLLELDGAVVTGRALHHGDAPAVGYRIERAGRSVVFAGDIDRSGLPSLESLARGADLLVVSCAVLDPPASPEALYARHTGPRLLAETAARAGVGRLLLTHLPPAVLSRRSDVEQSVHAAFKGGLLVAADGLRATVEAAPVLSTDGAGGCRSNADCGRGKVCVSCGKESSCVAGCSTLADCGPGQICAQVQCIRCPCPAQCRTP